MIHICRSPGGAEATVGCWSDPHIRILQDRAPELLSRVRSYVFSPSYKENYLRWYMTAGWLARTHHLSGNRRRTTTPAGIFRSVSLDAPKPMTPVLSYWAHKSCAVCVGRQTGIYSDYRKAARLPHSCGDPESWLLDRGRVPWRVHALHSLLTAHIIYTPPSIPS